MTGVGIGPAGRLEEPALTAGAATKIRVLPAADLRVAALLTRTKPPPTQRGSERVAQVVEHVTFNHGVEGSSPSALTNPRHLERLAYFVCSFADMP